MFGSGPNRDRYIMAGDFFTGVKRTSLEPGEIVTGVVFPPLKENQRCVYIKHAVRKAMDLAIIGVAVNLTMDGTVCTDARTALGAVVGRDVTVEAIRAENDAVYVGTGARSQPVLGPEPGGQRRHGPGVRAGGQALPGRARCQRPL